MSNELIDQLCAVICLDVEAMSPEVRVLCDAVKFILLRLEDTQ